ncbi:UvrD-helicase domain-containing protein [Spirosoma spitsbergense]|uniref:UvrD-helicase domain-containing protein n=1 Tax=Spirosoma spitsbergense TaxID=431554 RepID=UPI000376BA6D|nr:ATP-dependent helicase [Spirosoma spitsbergense]
MISLLNYFLAIQKAFNNELPLDLDQQAAVEHTFTEPLWIIAGPGTGKTHTLVWLVLKRILVDSVPADRIVLTTFTRKAATELRSRLLRAKQQLVSSGLREAEEIDVTQVFLGTLHSLCARILRDQRYEPTLRIRVLADERVQEYFLRRTRNPILDINDVTFWARFRLARYQGGQTYLPSRAKRAEGGCILFNRITENGADLNAMRTSGDPHFALLADAYEQYQQNLQQDLRTDQATLQRHFLTFLQSPEGQTWLGNGMSVVVDEYQDTNPVQEEIYFALTGGLPDFTVVGDDDQSLYRFRGATVESLIDFDRACLDYIGIAPRAVYLRENRRSHNGIVEWVNRFIQHHPSMIELNPLIRVRAPGKPALVARSPINGAYQPVQIITRSRDSQVGAEVSTVIQDLLNAGYITDYSQVALLTFSTSESNWAIGAYIDALDNAGIPYINPRSKAAQNDTALLEILGALSSILDPIRRFSNTWTLPDGTTFTLPGRLVSYIQEATNAFQQRIATGSFPDLEVYINDSITTVSGTPFDPSNPYLLQAGGQRTTISSLFFKLIAHSPYSDAILDPAHGERLKVINQLLAEYESLYDEGAIKVEQALSGQTQTETWSLYNLYAVFAESYHDGLNDSEDEDVSIVPGCVNVMTIHQSKGLQFEVVFIIKPENTPFLGTAHVLEDQLAPYINRPTQPLLRRSIQLRVEEDIVRLFFVGYSRAKRLLILAGTNLARWDTILGRDVHGQPINNQASLIGLNVNFL